MDTKRISEILKDKNIKPSYARIQIYNYLVEGEDHPSVEEIYNHLVEEIPTLSKTTVYNTLKTFEENNIVCSISIDNIEKRYEILTTDHIHFSCEECGKIYDIPYKEKSILPEEFRDFNVREKNIFLKGICENCNKKSTL